MLSAMDVAGKVARRPNYLSRRCGGIAPTIPSVPPARDRAEIAAGGKFFKAIETAQNSPWPARLFAAGSPRSGTKANP
jgi:hypothetical protein